jgi:hypothetical protein
MQFSLFMFSSGSETLNLSFQIQYGAPFQFRLQLAVFGAHQRCVRSSDAPGVLFLKQMDMI